MEQLTNFERVAPYYLKIYDDKTIEAFNRKNLPVGLESKEQVLETQPVKISLTQHRINKLKGLSEVVHGEIWVYYFTGDMNNPEPRPRRREIIENYFNRKCMLEKIIYGF